MATFVLQTVESGRRNLSATTLARLCDGFEVDIQELLLPAAPLAEPKRGRPKKALTAADGKLESAPDRGDNSVTGSPMELGAELTEVPSGSAAIDAPIRSNIE